MAKDECWEWTGYRRGGYGRARVNGVVMTVHRAAYEALVGTSHDVTRCPAGHPYVKENLASWAARRGWRQCLVCHALREKARKATLREKAKRAA